MKNLFKNRGYLIIAAVMAGAWGCSKKPLEEPPVASKVKEEPAFTQYIIRGGAHFSTNSHYEAVDVTEYRFQVRFDSSAIYTLPGGDQYDINKLAGFADNGGLHQQFSARIGWRWADGNLGLFGFVHNNGAFEFKTIGNIEIGKVYTCSIRINEGEYVFNIEDLNKTIRIKRDATTATSRGYRLYPYFGGNLFAPHEVRIWIRYL